MLPGDYVKLLDGGGAAYPPMLHAIEAAEKSVHLEVYAFSPFGVGARFVDVLGNAARRGVSVTVSVDGWGSALGGRVIASTLARTGCTVRIHNRLTSLLLGRFDRNHRKVLVVDDQVAFLGGINIGDENLDRGGRASWADLALEIRGPDVAHLGAMVRNEPCLVLESPVAVRLCGMGGGWRLRGRYLRAFAAATTSIHVAHGYFLPDRGIIRALVAAARRGVGVHLLLAGRSDVPLARAAMRTVYRRLLDGGVHIHEWSHSVLHAKVASIDGAHLLIGSFNLDPFSLANLEALVEVTDPCVVREGESWITAHVGRAREITTPELSTLSQRLVLDPFGRLVARIADAISRTIAPRRGQKWELPTRRSRPT